MNKLLKIAIMFAIPLAMWFITPPEGLSVGAWRLLGFYLMAILVLLLNLGQHQLSCYYLLQVLQFS